MSIAESSELFFSLIFAAVAPLAFPASALLLASIANPQAGLIQLKEAPKQIADARPLKKIGLKVSTALSRRKNEFILFQYPFLSVVFASIAWVLLICWEPVGLGGIVTQWLGDCLTDAQFSPYASFVYSGPWGDIAYPFSFDYIFWYIVNCVWSVPCETWVSLLLTGALFSAALPFVLRLSAFYQIFLEKLMLGTAGGGIVESLHDTLSLKRIKVLLHPRHPHLKSAVESVLWIGFCYGTLWSVVALTQGPVQFMIKDWLQCSARSSGWELGLTRNDMFFLATIVAAFGTAPLAITGCAFLPLRRPSEILVSAQGVLLPSHFVVSPLKKWSDLKRVTVSKPKRKNPDDVTLKLDFGKAGKIKIPLATVSPEQKCDLLAAIDEHAGRCDIDARIIQMRSTLASERRLTVDEDSKFESAIFKPFISGATVKEGKYRIVREISSKPLSAVYLARDDKSDVVVLKQFVLPNESDAVKSMRRGFQREYELLSSLDHPMLTKVLDVFEEDNASYLVLEHVKGQDLRSLVKHSGARKEKIVVGWARQICALMQFLHGKEPPIIHRDLSPDNIFLDECGQIRLVDFGAAHQFIEGVTGTLIGKQCYIAPEQLRGKATTRSDIYSFGGTLYFLLTGRDPRALSQCDFKTDEIKISDSLKSLIMECTNFDENARPASFEEIVARL